MQSGVERVTSLFRLNEVERAIADDPKFLSTLASYSLILLIYINLNMKSLAVGIVAFFLYFLINGIFLAHAFFEKEDAFFRLMFSIILLIMLLGLVGWLVMIASNLDAPNFLLVLFIVATISSLLNRRMNHENVTI